MKKINGFWVDENNNSWDCRSYSEEDAIKYSETLINCINCINCSNCINCRNCSNCSNCSYCSDCSNCSNCSNCSGCSSFETNPERYVSYSLGSRKDNTTFYFYDNKIYVVCGCFNGNMQEFVAKINETYTEDDNHYKDYMKLIEKVKTIFEEDEQ